MKRWKIVPADLVKSLIDFLDEAYKDAAMDEQDEINLQKINFINYAIDELLNSNDGVIKGYIKGDSFKPQKKSRQDYVDETFMDWNLPEMTDEEYEKLVDQFDAFLRGWEKEYNKKNPNKKQIKERPEKEFKPRVSDVAEYCSLEEIEEMLKDDPELSDWERFELYYEERERIKNTEEGLSYDELLKQSGIKPFKKK